jgi:hypothetical protein
VLMTALPLTRIAPWRYPAKVEFSAHFLAKSMKRLFLFPVSNVVPLLS